MSNEEQNGNIAKPLLAAGAIKEAVEILSAEMNVSLHFSKYPQDRWKNESEPPEISRLISTAEFHKKRWQEIKSVIDHLVAVSITKLKRGGKRPFSGAKQKYGEKTKTIAFRVPESKTDEIKLIVKTKLQEYECKRESK